MAKAVYLGVGGTAHKVRKAYIGVGGAARKVKKIYIGVGGQARLCYAEGMEYIGKTANGLYTAKYDLAAASVGNYAIFAGGHTSGVNGGAYDKNVDAFDGSLTRTFADDLSYGKYGLAATTVGSWAVFAGGVGYYNNGSNVEAYNSSLTRTTAESLSNTTVCWPGATTIAYNGHSFALFAGGGQTADNSSAGDSYKVDCYNTNLTKFTVANLTRRRRKLAAETVGGYALFAGGGYTDSDHDFVELNSAEVYDVYQTKRDNVQLSWRKSQIASAHVGDYAIFVSPDATDKANCFNSSLTRTLVDGLYYGCDWPAGVSTGEYALFNERDQASIDDSAWVQLTGYNASLTRTYVTGMSGTGANRIYTDAKTQAAMATVGGYVLLGGGTDIYTKQPASDVYAFSI